MLAGNHAQAWGNDLPVPTDWHDTPMSATGLLGPLDKTSTTLRAMGGAAERQGGRSTSNLLRLRPDAPVTVAVNRVLKKVAILEHCRPHDTVDRGPPDPPQDSLVTLDSEQEASGTGNVEAEVVNLEPGLLLEKRRSLSPIPAMSSKRTRTGESGMRVPATGSASARRTSAKRKNIWSLHKPSAGSSKNRSGKPEWWCCPGSWEPAASWMPREYIRP